MRILNERYEQNVPLDTLHDWDGNPNDGDDAAVGESLAETGFYGVLICDIDTRKILAGHTRKRSLLAAGETVAPAVQWVRTDDADHARAVLLGDNRINRRGQDDRDRLLEALRVQAESARGLAGTGFGQVDVEDLMAQQREAAATAAALGRPAASDEVPDPPAVPVTRAGDVWLLGEHRLLCGDATSVEDIKRLLDGNLADLVFTDPPYGVGYTGGAKPREALAGDEVGTTIYADSLQHLREVAADHASLYLWYADAHAAAAAAAAAGYVVTAQIIWVKNNAQFVTAAHYKGKHEICFYAHRKGKTARWTGPNNEVTVWEVDRANKNEFHPTQKPIALPSRAIRNSSHPGDVVLDLFGGSGSTLMASEQEGRQGRLLEIDPAYCDVIAARFERHTGTVPILGATGEPHTFTEAV